MNLRFRNILVLQKAESNSVRALSLARDLSREREDSRITVVDFVPQTTWAWRALCDGAWKDNVIAHKTESLHEKLKSVGMREDEATVEVADKRPITEIQNRLSTAGHDLLVKDAHAEIADLYFGSLDMRLIRHANCPVLLTQPNRTSALKRLLAAVDPEAQPHEHSLNREIIRQASAFAKLHSAELHVVGAWQSPIFNFDNSEENVVRYESSKAEVERVARGNFKAIIDNSLSAVAAEYRHFHNGEPSQQILDVISQISADLLVIGSLGRSGIPGFFIGNTSEKVIRQVNCELLRLKPPKSA